MDENSQNVFSYIPQEIAEQERITPYTYSDGHCEPSFFLFFANWEYLF